MKAITIISGLFLLLLTGCAYEKISVSYKTPFDKYKTFAWLHREDEASKMYKGDKVHENAVQYINHSFILKGYTIDTSEPDMLLDMKLLDENKVAVTKCVGYCPVNNYVGYYYPFTAYEFFPTNSTMYPHSPWRYEMDTVYYENRYKERTITLNVVDRKTKKIIWSGTAVGDLYDDKTLNNVVNPIVRKLMKKFPVRSKVKKIKF